MSKSLLIIFIRNPELGKVKTRLAATLGAEKALLIYQSLLKHTYKVSKELDSDKWTCYSSFVPENDEWKTAGYIQHLQTDGDLGEKMVNAFNAAFHSGYSKVVLIGSDCPELTNGILEDSFAALDKYDSVLGPAIDGGYYLIGLTKMAQSIFTNKNWSTDTVHADTVTSLNADKLSFALLPELRDLDNIEDLNLLKHALQL